MKKLSIWHVTREYAGLAEAGGLKDVTRGLAEASMRRGHQVSVILPFYGFMASYQLFFKKEFKYCMKLGNDPIELTIYQVELNSINIYLVKSNYYEDKDHPYLYLSTGDGHNDSLQMNIILQHSTIFLLKKIAPPSIMHLHDAHTAYLPAMAKEALGSELFNKLIFIVTIHNAGSSYQQRSANIDQIASYTQIPSNLLAKALINGEVSPFALATFDAYITTVSPEYAISLKKGDKNDETKGLSSFFSLYQVEIEGIYNGINVREWDAAYLFSRLPYRYYPLLHLWGGKVKTKSWVIKKIEGQSYGLTQHGKFTEAIKRPLYLFHSRLVEQKGVSILIESLKLLIKKNIAANFLIIGQGSHRYEQAVRDLTEQAQNRIIFINGYQSLLIKEAIAASDFFLLPSRFEPCGLTDLYAHMLGTLPIAHNTGGLGKIENNKTGFFMDYYDADSFAYKIEEVNDLYHRDHKKIKSMARHAYIDRKNNFDWISITCNYYEQCYYRLYSKGVSC